MTTSRSNHLMLQYIAIIGVLILIPFKLFSQEGLKEKLDSLEQVISQTKSEDRLVQLFSAQIELAEQMKDLLKVAEVELKLAKVSSFDGVEMQKHAYKAFKAYTMEGDTANMIEAAYTVAYGKQLQSDYDSTRHYAQRVVNLAESARDTVSIIRGRLLISSVYNHMSLYPQSLQELNKSKVLAESINGNKAVMVDIFNRESFIYYSLREYDKSGDRILKIIELIREDNDDRRMNIWLNNLASVYSLCNCVSFERRKEVLKESIEYAEKINFTYGKAFAYKHMADTYRDAGQFDSTRYYLDKIEILLPEINKPDFTGLVNVAQGSYWNYVKNETRAIPYFKKAYNIWKELGKQKDQMEIALLLNNIYQERSDYANAYKYLREYTALRDSLYSEEKIREVKELELSYDFRQKQITDSLKNEDKLNILSLSYEYEAALQKRSKLIIILVSIGILVIACIIYYGLVKQKKLAELLKVKSDQVENELHQKELLLTEIHHRVKNNFQILSSLLELQAKGVDDQATKDLISEGKSRVKSMALIHSQLYENEGLTIHLAEYLQNLINEIQKSFEGQTSEIEMNVDPKYTLDIDNMVPLGLIANELVTNAFKYASSPGNPLTLQVGLSEENGKNVLIFKDNGPGLPSDFDVKTAKSTGIWLISRLALQLHGHYEYEYNNGAIFKIHFSQREFVNT